MEEQWKVMPVFPDYEISNYGVVRRTTDVINPCNGAITSPRGRIIKQSLTKGYMTVGLYKPQSTPKQFQVRIHQMVALMFIGPCPPDKEEVNHIDTNKLNNRSDNLEYMTSGENSRHAVANGLARPRKGESHPFAKFTEDDVREMRRLHDGGMPQIEICLRFPELKKSRVNAIVLRKSWRHVQ